jgi:hypothetical protein
LLWAGRRELAGRTLQKMPQNLKNGRLEKSDGHFFAVAARCVPNATLKLLILLTIKKYLP